MGDLGFDDFSLARVPPQQGLALIAAYLRSLPPSLRSSSPAPLAPKTLTGYVNAAADVLRLYGIPISSSSTPSSSPLSPSLPTPIPPSPTQFPMIHTILADRQRWRQPMPRKEPLTYDILLAAYSAVRATHAADRMSYLSLPAAAFDWIRLGLFTGSRISEYAQPSLPRGTLFATAPDTPTAGPWRASPLAFILEDFSFYTANGLHVSHACLLSQLSTIDVLHIRFRFQKNSDNFVVRKYLRQPTFLCPVKAAINIVRRFICLRPSLPRQPLGLFQAAPTAVAFLRGPHIVQVMRSACLSAYPNPDHYLRRHITSLVTHSMRVTAAVALAQAGISIEDIAFRLRWSPQSVTTYLRDCTHQIGRLTHAAIVGALSLH